VSQPTANGPSPPTAPRRKRPPRSQEVCGTCQRLRPVKARTREGQAQCSACRRRDPATWQPCLTCGRTRPVNARTPEGKALCVSCYRPPTRTCQECGILGPIASRAEGKDLCARRYSYPVRPCGACGRTRRIAVTARGDRPDLCPTCHQAPTLICGRCGLSGPCRTTTTDRSPICWRCQLHRAIDQAFGTTIPAPFLPLVEAMRAAEYPRSVLGWLACSPAAPLLSAMIHGSDPLEHRTLDAATAEKWRAAAGANWAGYAGTRRLP
jgi:hypothetical protein